MRGGGGLYELFCIWRSYWKSETHHGKKLLIIWASSAKDYLFMSNQADGEGSLNLSYAGFLTYKRSLPLLPSHNPAELKDHLAAQLVVHLSTIIIEKVPDAEAITVVLLYSSVTTSPRRS